MSRSSLGRMGLLLVSLLGLMSVFSASAFAAGPPIVTVSGATNKSLNTATLNGTVDNNGSGSSYKIEYGTTKLYGKTTTSSTVSGVGAVPVSKLVTGLQPLTTYHYRISATNSFGTTLSADMTFEMLLAWKVGGKYLSELESPWGPPTVQHEKEKETVTLERTISSKLAKITCVQNYVEKYGVLGVEYNLPFKECVAFYDGKERKDCTVKDMVLHLDAVGMPSPAGQKMELGEECMFGEKIIFNTGFAVGPFAAQKVPSVTLTAVDVSSWWTVKYGPSNWSLMGAEKGLTLGIE